MASSADVYVFGDQSTPVLDKLQALVRVKDNALLTSFLGEAFLAVRREIVSLSSLERKSIPEAESLSLLLEGVRRSEPHAALDSAFVCIYEIGYYIDYLARSDKQHPSASPSFLLGICTGSIAAAAVSCAKDVFEISRLGVEAATVAFRLGMHVRRRAENLGYSTPSSWSMILSSNQEELVSEALQQFSNEKNLTPSTRPYISAIGPGFTTISGPPSILESLKASDAFSGKRLYPAPIYGPYHNSSAYSESSLDNTLASILQDIEFLENKMLIPIISCASGSRLHQLSFGDLLDDVLSSALSQQIRMDLVTDALLETISGTEATLIPVNAQTTVCSLSDWLAKRGATTLMGPTLESMAKDRAEPQVAPGDDNKIAIIGFSGRFPEADNLDEFWDLLIRGLDVHKPVPEERFARDHYDPTGQRKNTSQVQYGCWLKSAGHFDTQFFHMSPKEAIQTDPAQRLALLTAYEALEMAGVVPDRTPSTQRNRVGVYYGTTSNDWGEVNSSQDVDTYYIPGANRAFIPGRVNYFFKFTGPSIAVDTACSSSLAAINLAITSLKNRDCDTAIAGGTNVMTNPDNFAGLDRGHFLSRTGNCKAFDDGADGYCRADGIGTLILKRLPDAIADSDPIFGVILGAHTNHSAESVSITRPLADAQEYLFKKLLNETGIHPHDVSYVEMHGTGTQAGDAVEMRSVLNSFAFDHSRPRDKSLYLGSVKANVGHAESASGVLAIIKVLLMMQKNTIPPHCGIKTKINQGFPKDLDHRGVRIALKDSVEWTRPEGGKRRVLVNNFSAAGGNTSLLLEDAPAVHPARQHQDVDVRTEHVVAVSARSTKALEENLKALEAFIANSWAPEGDLLSQLSYTTTARRVHHSRRVAFVTNGLDDLRKSLLKASAAAGQVKGIPAVSPKVGFLFTGQGAQETAMAIGYYKSFSSFRSDIHQLDSIATLQGLPSVLPLIHGTTPVEDLSAVIVQLGTCIIQIALARFCISLGITPQYVIGHSLGEYAALQIAGVLSVNDAIFLCGHRAALLDKKCTAYTHGMVAVKAAADDLRQHISSDLKVEIACVNGAEDTVLSGPNADIESLCGKLTQAGYKLHKLEIPFAFHSSQVDPILDDLEELASQVEFHEPKLPIVSPLLCTLLTGDTLGPQYIRRHCRETVDFLSAIKMAEAQGIMDRSGMCIEIGAHPILTRMVKSIIGQEFRCLASLRRKEDHFKTLADSLCALHLAGFSVNWDEYHRDFASSRNVLQLPKYSWQLANYWMQYKYSWCLTKGDEPVETTAIGVPVQARALRLSDSVHNVIEQVHGDKRSSITGESDMHDPSLLAIAQNHRVNNLTMAPSTLFADIAFTLAKHLIENHGLDTQTNLPSINNMAVEKALIVGETGPQLFRASLDMDWTSMHGSVRIFSVNASGKQTTLHAVCDVAVENPSTHRESWQSHAYLIQRGIKQLVQGASDGSAHMMRRGLLYKIFSNSVQYGSAFQGIEQVWFDSEGLEGTGKVFMPSGKDTFALNPYCCDSLGHITGFIMNCSDSLDLDDHVYINHGWRTLRLVEPYQCDVQYQTYVKMQAVGSDDSTYSGDVHVLRDGKIIGICGGVTFKKVARKVLEMLLPKPSGAKAKHGAVKHVAPEPIKHAVLTPPSTTSHSLGTVSPPEQTESPVGSASGLVQKALEIIADEIGVDISDLTDSTLLADLGVDSLMSLTILGNFREELDLDIPAAQFYEFSTVQDLKSFLGANDQDFSSSNSEAESSASSAASTSPSDHGDDVVEVKPVVAEIPRSTSTILQGTKHCSRTLFLFPDGAGSATSYVTLPSISPDMRVIGLNSPYLTKPHEFNCALQDITGSYLNEVRRRQPSGPYHLAGWSAGGVSAFDAARQLVSEGEVVESLILIDSPNPVGLGKLPKRMYDFLEKSGIFGAFEMGEEAQAPPDWLFQHFCVFIEALDRYVPEPFEHGMAPKTTIIWAADGVCKNPDDPRPEAQPDDPRGMNWLLNNREDFGPNGWDEFIGPENIGTMAIENANHFTMMREPIASALCAKIREAMGARVSIPTVKDGAEWPFLYRIYLNCLAWTVHKLVSFLTGLNEGHDLQIKIDTPGLGAGHVICNVWLPRSTNGSEPKHPLVLVLEGGGFVFRHPKDGRLNNRRIVDQTRAIVMSVDYAKAPRYPYPHALLQAYEALRWALTCPAACQGICVDPSRVAIGGNSAGGNLTASLSLLLSFRSGPCYTFRERLPLDFKQVMHFMLYPSLELRLPYDLRLSRSTTDAQKHSLPTWMAQAMEQSYLPPRICKDDVFVSPVAASIELLRELDIPPALLFTGSLDCLKEEGFCYAQNFTKSDKEVSFHEFGGGTHGFSVRPKEGSSEAQNIYEECWDRICRSLREASV
ncbi:polyketide synthase [Fusarium tjaetaba]|uniref:Polyketide synthase n=1 Tax=Fusarium tjaetaba TaxID=1567544 RepID=A0A8H5VX95_9HYPO|nr:polyketide synthase [Fusarium tjaetaba]KAF5637638.1 polyketide synthase [Fusarium tjaetaba]